MIFAPLLLLFFCLSFRGKILSSSALWPPRGPEKSPFGGGKTEIFLGPDRARLHYAKVLERLNHMVDGRQVVQCAHAQAHEVPTKSSMA